MKRKDTLAEQNEQCHTMPDPCSFQTSKATNRDCTKQTERNKASRLRKPTSWKSADLSVCEMFEASVVIFRPDTQVQWPQKGIESQTNINAHPDLRN